MKVMYINYNVNLLFKEYLSYIYQIIFWSFLFENYKKKYIYIYVYPYINLIFKSYYLIFFK